NALGERVGEVTSHSAIIHTRLTAQPIRNNRGYNFPFSTHSLTWDQRRNVRMPAGMTVAELEGACPGKEGLGRIRDSAPPDVGNPRMLDWTKLGPATDFTHQFQLEGLSPATLYNYVAEYRSLSGGDVRRGGTGSFRTAPLPDPWE